jgi:5-methylcytosine-specific restriction enzyme subunit McrC
MLGTRCATAISHCKTPLPVNPSTPHPDQIGRNDTDDQLMVSLARLVFDLVFPTEEAGSHTFSGIEREERIVRHLFEKAVGNFLAAEMSGNDGWRVYQGQKLSWAIEAATAGVRAILPNMKTDIALENAAQGSRVVIDTKFTEIVTTTAYRDAVLKSGYIYQMYAYLRSQARKPCKPVIARR